MALSVSGLQAETGVDRDVDRRFYFVRETTV